MRSPRKVLLAFSGLVFVGLVALALLMMSSGAPSAPQTVTAITPPTSSASTEEPAVVEASGIPDGYVEMGDGTWIPEGGPGDCAASALISITGTGNVADTARLLKAENLSDMGPREFATGDVGHHEDGRIATYTVAPGDSLGAIGDRFCIYNGLSLATLNGYRGYEPIQPGELLVLDPAAVPGFAFVNPEPG